MALWQKSFRMAAGKMPKVIDPTTHALLDYAVAGSFLLMGVLFWKRSKRAAIGSLFCCGATAANIMLTDYPGGTRKVVSYKSHGRIDAGLAGMHERNLLSIGRPCGLDFVEIAPRQL